MAAVPDKFKTAGLLNIAGGVLTILASLMWILSLIWVCVGVVWFVPLAAAGFQLYIGVQQQSGKPTPQGKIAAIVGIVSALCCFNFFGVAISVGAFVMSGGPEVDEFLANPDV